MRAIFATMTTLTSTLDVERLLGYVVRLCAEVGQCAGALLYLWDEDRERLVVRAAVEGYERWIGRFSLALGEGLTGWTALNRQPGIIRDDPTADPRFRSVPELNDERFQSYLTVPIVAPNQRLLGVITMHTEAPHEFTDDDLSIMETISALIGSAVDNAQLYERQSRQVRVLHSLAEASHAVVETPSLRHLLFRLASTAGALFGSDRCAVLTLDEAGTHLAVEAVWPDAGGGAPATVSADGPWGRLLGATEPVVLGRREHREAFDAFDALVAGSRSLLAAPMRVSERVVGAFLCFSRTPHAFGREDRELLATIAAQAALAVENARLIAALSRKNVVRDLFEALAQGEDGELGIDAQARRLDVDLSRPHAIAMFEAVPPNGGFDGERVWQSLRRDLVAELPGSVVTSRDLTSTALLRLPDAVGPGSLSGRLAQLKAAHERAFGLVLSAGISRVCSRAEDYPEAFEQARRALLMGRAVRGSGAVVAFDELGAQWHLFTIAQQQARDVYQERLELLAEHDQAKGTQLFRTLEVYLESMGNAKLAAERLFVHRNTLRQRFEKIRRVSDVDVSDQTHWFDLMMAVRIIRLRELSR